MINARNCKRLCIVHPRLILASEQKRIYDGNGNLVSDGTYYREYSGFNQLIRIRQGNTSSSPVLEEYKWHPTEERIVIKRIFNNGVLNSTVYYPNENYVVIVNSSGTFKEKYIYQEGVLVAQVNTDGQKQAIHSDNEGSNTLITDSNGNVVENTFYSPYGEIIKGGKSSRYGTEAKEYDSLVDDVDFKFRKYNPKIPLFNQPDTLIKNVYDPQSLNRYAFERNNPYKYSDPKGHNWVELMSKIIEQVNRHLENSIVTQENRQAAEDSQYEMLYDEYRRENPYLSMDPYERALVSGGYRKADVIQMRRISYDELKQWKQQQLERKMQADKYISAANKGTDNILQINVKNLGQMPNIPTQGTYTSTVPTIGPLYPLNFRSAYKSGGTTLEYTINYNINGQITGGSIGGIGLSKGFARLFNQVINKGVKKK